VTLADVITRGGNKGNMSPNKKGKHWGIVGTAPVIVGTAPVIVGTAPVIVGTAPVIVGTAPVILNPSTST
jgi:hypothetical protein